MQSLQTEKYKQTEVLIYPNQYISAGGAFVSYPKQVYKNITVEYNNLVRFLEDK